MPNPFVFSQTPEEQSALWAQLRQGEAQRAAYMAQASPAIADAVGTFHNRAPYADPGVALSVGTAASNGSINPEQIAQSVDQSVLQGNRPAWTPAESSGLMDTIRQNVMMRMPQAEQNALQLKALEKQVTAQSDPLIRDAQGNIDVAKTAKAAGVEPAGQSGGGGPFDFANPFDYLSSVKDVAFSAAKGATREALAAASTGMELAQTRAAQEVHAVGDIGGALASGDFGGAAQAGARALATVSPGTALTESVFDPTVRKEALGALASTNLGQQMIQGHQMGSIDLGEGWLPGGTVTHVWQPEAARQVRGVIPGTNSAWTYGRQIASVVASPGSKQYNTMSGLIDGAMQYAGDPSLAFADAMQVPRAAQVFQRGAQAAEEAPAAAEAIKGTELAVKAPPLSQLVHAPSVEPLISDLAKANTPQSVARLIGSDVSAKNMATIVGSTNRTVIRNALLSEGAVNPDWRDAFTQAAGPTAGQVLSSMGGKSVIAELQDAKSPEMARSIVGSDVSDGTLQRIAGTDSWPKIRQALTVEAKRNPEWWDAFQKVGADAADHVASTPVAYYHGTATPVASFSSEPFADSGSGYGPGLYTTSDPEQAAGYAANKGGATVQALSFGGASPRTLNMAQTAPQALRGAIQAAMGERDMLPSLERALADPDVTGGALYAAFRNSVKDEALFGDLSLHVADELKNAGIDALEYGASGGATHTIFLDPSRLVPYESPQEAVANAAQGVLLDADRTSVASGNVDQFLEHKSTQPFWQRLANTSNPIEVAKRLGPQAPPSLISAVTKAETADDVKNAVRGELGLSIATPSQIPGLGFGYEFKRNVIHAIPGLNALTSAVGTEAARAFSKVPDEFFQGFLPDATDTMKRATLNNMDDWAKTVKVDPAIRARAFGTMADAFASGSGEARFQALTAWADVMKEGMVNLGIPEDAAKNTMNLFKERPLSVYAYDQLGRPTDFNMMATATGNADLSMASPAMLSQEIGTTVQMPDPREIRRLTSPLGRALAHIEYDPNAGIIRAARNTGIIAVPQYLAENVFPRFAIMRAATALRVMMDEQLRLAVGGYTSIFHPIQWISAIAGSNLDLEKLGLTHEVADQMIDQVAGTIASSDSNEAVLKATRATGGMVDVEKGDKWVTGHMDTMRQMARDPIGSQVLQGMTNDQIFDYLRSTEGADHFDRYQQLAQNAKSRLASTGRIVPSPLDLNDDATLKAWIQRTRDNVDAMTKGNTDMRAALGGGALPDHYASLNGEQGAAPFAFDTGVPTPGYRKMTEEWMQHPDSPERVQYMQRLSDYKDPSNLKDAFDSATKWAMGKLFNVPVRTLTRSPVFRAEFYQRVAELADQLHPDEANRLLKNIESYSKEQGFAGKVADWIGGDDKLQAVIDGAKNANGDLKLDEVFNYAKAHAIDTVHDVLYNVASKTNLEQSLRAFVPFAQAWRMIIADWTKLIAQNPGFIRRAQMAVEGGRGSGFFYTDPISGKEMFNYPGSDWVVKAITGGAVGTLIDHALSGAAAYIPGGVGDKISDAAHTAAGVVPGLGDVVNASGGMPGPDPLRGEVQGLNLVSSSFLPGLGPVIQMPLAHLLRNQPWADDVKGLLMPYGVPNDENSPLLGELGAYLMPAWMQKVTSAVTTSPDSTSTYGNTYSQTLEVLASSGKYGTSPEERHRLIEDAQAKARILTMLRGIGQFVAPSSPTYDPEVATNIGDKTVAELAKDAHTLQAADFNTWVKNFTNLYGEGPINAVQSKTRAQNGGLDASKAFGQWEDSHQPAMNTYPTVAGYFADIGSDFDQEVFNRQVAGGERKKLSGDELINASQATIAKWKYDQAKQAVGAHPTTDQLNWLRDVKNKLGDQYPGFAIEPATQIADLPTKIKQLDLAVKDPSLKGDTQTAAATYLALRQRAIDEAKARNPRSNGLASASDADLRAWLSGAATTIIQKYPTFSRLFDGVLSAEVDQ